MKQTVWVHTVSLQPVSSHGALKPCRELSVKGRQTHHPRGCWLHRAAPVSASDPQQGWNWKAKTDAEAVREPLRGPSPSPRTRDAPISLLWLSWSKCWWIISFSTEKICSFSALVSLMAFFPRWTLSWRMSLSLLCQHQRENISAPQKNRRRRRGFAVSPVIETVRSGDHPAGRDERTTAEEAMAEDGGDPGLRLHRGERAVHDFVGPRFRPLAARLLCRDTQDEVRKERREKGGGGGGSRATPEYLCPTQQAGVSLLAWGLESSRDQKSTETLTFSVIFSQTYNWERCRIPSWSSFLCGRSTTVSSSGQGSWDGFRPALKTRADSDLRVTAWAVIRGLPAVAVVADSLGRPPAVEESFPVQAPFAAARSRDVSRVAASVFGPTRPCPCADANILSTSLINIWEKKKSFYLLFEVFEGILLYFTRVLEKA